MNLPTGIRVTPLVLAMTMLPFTAPAQTVPDSGQMLQQVKPEISETPAKSPSVDVQRPGTAPADDTTPIRVDRIVIDGASAFDAASLHALVAGDEGRDMTLAQLQGLAQRITDYYHAHGYPLARALVPAQTLEGGVVHIRVVEARYDSVNLDNRSRVGDDLLRATLAPMRQGEVVTQASLDRSLLLLSDLPGVDPHATLRPGATVGTSRVDVVADATPLLSGDVRVDNAGNRYTGRARIGADLDINNPLHHGDLLSLSVLTAGHDLAYGRAAYQFTLNGAGTRLGAAYSALRYDLGGAVSGLGAHGTAQVSSAWLSQPLVRSRDASLDLRAQFDRKRLHDDLDIAALRNDRHSDNWTLGLYGQHRDGWLGGGINSGSLAVTRGKLGFDDAVAQAADAATARTRGNYTHWNASLSRLQSLGATTRLYAAVSGQGSTRNLDSSEQFLLGGPDSVRAYEVGSAAGASGWLATLELRQDLAWGCAGRCEGRLFVDSGALRVNADTWTSGNNHVRLSGAGLGFDWIGTHRWLARVQVATPIGAVPEGLHDDTQWWLQVSKGF